MAFARGEGALALVDTMGNLCMGSSSFHTTLSPLLYLHLLPHPAIIPLPSALHIEQERLRLLRYLIGCKGTSILVVFNRGEGLLPIWRLMGVRGLLPLWCFFLSFFRKQSFDSNVSGVSVLLVINTS